MKKITLISIFIVSLILAIYCFVRISKTSPNIQHTDKYLNLLKVNEVNINKVRNNNILAASNAVENIKSVFNYLKANVSPTVDDLYSLKNKLKFIGKGTADLWPWSKKKDRVNESVKHIFEKHFGSNEEITEVMSVITENYRREIEANKNEFILSIEYDTERGKEKVLSINKNEFLDLMNNELSNMSEPLVKLSLAGEVSSLISGEIGACVASEIAATVSGSALSGWETFGIGVVVCVGADLIVSHFTKNFMEEELIKTIDEIEKLMLYGADDKPGIIKILNENAKAVTKEEEEALKNALLSVANN